VSVKFALRPYLSSDFDALYSLDRACYPPGIAYSRSMLRWFLKQPGAICIVAEDANVGADAEIKAFVLVEAEPPLGHIITLDVAAECRRSGLGTELTMAAENTLAMNGVREVELEAAIDNAAGIAFWTRHGYRTVGTIPRYYLDRVDALCMTKFLAAPKEI
jgi:[ribosomal protein S18]-alanine N-acetyltransferase